MFFSSDPVNITETPKQSQTHREHPELSDPQVTKWVEWALSRSWPGAVDQLALDRNNLTEHGMEQIYRFTSKVPREHTATSS